MISNKKIGNIAVVGGTHGNELTGIHTVKHWINEGTARKFESFQTEYLLANQNAISNNKRYIVQDLNRSFKVKELADESLCNQEQQLAKNINQQLGPKGNSRVDFIVDLHTSTANMQTNIVLIKIDEFHLKLAAYLKMVLPNVVITSETLLLQDHHFLCSIADKSLVIEVGPIAQGSLDYSVFETTNKTLEATLEFIEHYNKNSIPPLPETLQVMRYFSKLHFPTNSNNEISAVVHPKLIHQDYSKITKGDVIFKSFSGGDIKYDGESAHIAFVNEAAYYDQKIAMCLCNPVEYSLTDCRLISD